MKATPNTNSLTQTQTLAQTDVDDESTWVICSYPKCKNGVHPKRIALGYSTCLDHGGTPKKYTVAPAFNKGPAQLISPDDVKYIGRK